VVEKGKDAQLFKYFFSDIQILKYMDILF